jgi:hypothetical protein
VYVHPVTAEITKSLVGHVLVVHVHVTPESSRGHSAAVVVDREAISVVCGCVVEGTHLSVELSLGVRESLGWCVDERGGIHGRGAGGGSVLESVGDRRAKSRIKVHILISSINIHVGIRNRLLHPAWVEEKLCILA